MYVNTLIIKFVNKISSQEIPLFRGAIIAGSGACSDLFHNHQEEGFNYRYPLIQYKRIGGRAAIVCLGQGVEDIGAFFRNSTFQLQLGDRPPEVFEIESVTPQRTLVQVWDDTFHYYLNGWLPFNRENHQKYMEMEGMVERTQLLEEILTGNILTVCKGLDFTVPDRISCKMLQVEEPQVVRYKQLPYLSLNCQFKSNITLPNYIGLGKGASMGHGVIFSKTSTISDSNG